MLAGHGILTEKVELEVSQGCARFLGRVRFHQVCRDPAGARPRVHDDTRTLGWTDAVADATAQYWLLHSRPACRSPARIADVGITFLDVVAQRVITDGDDP
jgi:hypothetical protein